MRPKIRIRPLATDNVQLNEVLTLVKTAKQQALVVSLLQRYGAKRVSDLFPPQVKPFAEELKRVLRGEAPDPRDSVLDSTMMEIR